MDRSEGFRKWINNDSLSTYTCPFCEEELINQITKGLQNGNISHDNVDCVISTINSNLDHIHLQTAPDVLEFKCYSCPCCGEQLIGQNSLITSSESYSLLQLAYQITTAESEGRDIRTHPHISYEYNKIIDELNFSIAPMVSPQTIDTTNEDVISGMLVESMKSLFNSYEHAVFGEHKSKVVVVPEVHAGSREAGRKSFIPSGSDIGLWLGQLSEEHLNILERYKQKTVNIEQIPALFGWGLMLQAKKDFGKVKKKQVSNFMNYASLSKHSNDLQGISGKLFLSYSSDASFVSILPNQFTRQMCHHFDNTDLESIAFTSAKRSIAGEFKPVDINDAIKEFITCGIGAPIFTLRDVLGSKKSIVVSIPPGFGGPGDKSPLLKYLFNILNQMRSEYRYRYSYDSQRRIRMRYK